jgi:hypothetical protein
MGGKGWVFVTVRVFLIIKVEVIVKVKLYSISVAEQGNNAQHCVYNTKNQ